MEEERQELPHTHLIRKMAAQIDNIAEKEPCAAANLCGGIIEAAEELRDQLRMQALADSERDH